jgi:hypothetical protein
MPADKAIDTKTQFFRRYITASYINNENEKEERRTRKPLAKKLGWIILRCVFLCLGIFSKDDEG